jgi:hypothetical protein
MVSLLSDQRKELRPDLADAGATGNNGHFDDPQKVMEQCRHFGVERRFAFGQRAVQIINNELFHYLSISEFWRSE